MGGWEQRHCAKTCCEHTAALTRVPLQMPDLKVRLSVVGIPSTSKSTLMFDGRDWNSSQPFSIVEGSQTWVTIVARDCDDLEVKRSDYSIDIELSSIEQTQMMHLTRVESQAGYAAMLPQLEDGHYSLHVKRIFGYAVKASNSSLPLADNPLRFNVTAALNCNMKTQLQIVEEEGPRCIQPSIAATIQSKVVTVELFKSSDWKLPEWELRDDSKARLYLAYDLRPSSEKFLVYWEAFPVLSQQWCASNSTWIESSSCESADRCWMRFEHTHGRYNITEQSSGRVPISFNLSQLTDETEVMATWKIESQPTSVHYQIAKCHWRCPICQCC